MVLAELGKRLTGALKAMTNATIIDDEVVDTLLKEICNALMAADVNVKQVMKLRTGIKTKLKLDELPSGLDRRKHINSAVLSELCTLLDPGVKPYAPKKGKPNIIMFVGLQGAGKTTTVTKLAYHYKKANFSTALVCADTFRAGAFDQLKQNATKAGIPFFGSLQDADPVNIARQGVEVFKKDGTEIIIIDTSGRHKQEADLFEEMQQIATVVKPDNIIFVMDGSIGQAAFDQASAFKATVKIGSVIITKMDGHAKGGGALSAVAATQSPIIFLGTGEHIPDLELFDAKVFVSRLLGMGDLDGVRRMIEEIIPKAQQPALEKRLREGKFSLRDMYGQFENFSKMGSMNKMIEMIPGMSGLAQLPGMQGNEGNLKLKVYIHIMDSMTDEELDNSDIFDNTKEGPSRCARIARGAGRHVMEVNELLAQFKMMRKMIDQTKGVKGNSLRDIQKMTSKMPPEMMKKLGANPAQLQNMLKNLGGMGGLGGLGGMGGLADLAKSLGGGGGGRK